jgi:hypothetical protein
VETMVQVWIAAQTGWWAARRRLLDEVGEGVISTAIAVLIMSLIGLAMWKVFSTVFDDAGQKINDNVNQIG